MTDFGEREIRQLDDFGEKQYIDIKFSKVEKDIIEINKRIDIIERKPGSFFRICPIQRVPIGVRYDTGPLQFGGDWPGIFIRGDEVCGISDTLDKIINDSELDEGYVKYIKEFQTLLKSCQEFY